jgi:hypothetical protein
MIFEKYSNRRETWRHRIIEPITFILISRGKTFTQQNGKLLNINIDGLEIMFRDTDYLYSLLEEYELNDYQARVEFNYRETQMIYPVRINWINMQDTGEKSVLATAGLLIDKESADFNKTLHLDLLFSEMMENIYIP